MHLEILVEDSSGKKMLEELLPRLMSQANTFSIHSYKGVGRVPQNMRDTDDAGKRILLTNLPKLLKGYGRTFAAYPPDFSAAVVLVCDLDQRILVDFLAELEGVLSACNPSPLTQFCIAIEEGEAWLLGDTLAVKSAYPKAKTDVLNSYTNDSICGTWELLANAVYKGGERALSARGWQAVGAEKWQWAQNITPYMDLDNNSSPSFIYFRDIIRMIAG